MELAFKFILFFFFLILGKCLPCSEISWFVTVQHQGWVSFSLFPESLVRPDAENVPQILSPEKYMYWDLLSPCIFHWEDLASPLHYFSLPANIRWLRRKAFLGECSFLLFAVCVCSQMCLCKHLHVVEGTIVCRGCWVSRPPLWHVPLFKRHWDASPLCVSQA